jgi:hypothetical protein
VKRLLANKRYTPIGASLRTGSEQTRPRREFLVFIFYNYTDDVAITVRLDGKATRVEEVSQTRSQPTATEVEIDRAIALARSDKRLAKRVTSDLEGNALLVKGVDAYDRQSVLPYYYHRLIEVSFRRPDERGPLYQAIVDLSNETVLSVNLTLTTR